MHNIMYVLYIIVFYVYFFLCFRTESIFSINNYPILSGFLIVTTYIQFNDRIN